MRRPSPAMVVAFIALAISLGGTAFAAKQLITSSSQVKNGVLTGADIKDGSLGAKEISAAGRKTIRGSGSSSQSPIKGDRGLQGVPGPKGDQGLKGDTGPPGADALATTARTVYRSNFTIAKDVTGTSLIVLTMPDVAPGSYLFTAVQHLQATGPKSTTYSCALVSSTGGRTESAGLTLGTDGLGGVKEGVLNEQVTMTSTDPFTMRLVCTPETGATLDASVLSASVIALRLQSETATPVTG